MAIDTLMSEIIAISESDNWDLAKLEWQLAEIYHEDDPQTCLCGHYPIKEICVLENIKNGSVTEVGNVCVKKFMGIRSDLIFNCIKKIAKDSEKAINAETIDYAKKRGWLNNWEYKFCIDTIRKRNLSERQRGKRQEINEKILKLTRRN